MMALTLHQRTLLNYLGSEIAATGVAPSFVQMMDAMGLASKSGVHRLLKALEERGHIRRLKGHARAIEIIHQNTCPCCGYDLSLAVSHSGEETQRAMCPQPLGSLGLNSTADTR